VSEGGGEKDNSNCTKTNTHRHRGTLAALTRQGNGKEEAAHGINSLERTRGTQRKGAFAEKIKIPARTGNLSGHKYHSHGGRPATAKQRKGGGENPCHLETLKWKRKKEVGNAVKNPTSQEQGA